jgi:hypothetical protein
MLKPHWGIPETRVCEMTHTYWKWRQKLTMDAKDDPVSGQTKDALSEPKNLDYPQRFLLRVVAT